VPQMQSQRAWRRGRHAKALRMRSATRHSRALNQVLNGVQWSDTQNQGSGPATDHFTRVRAVPSIPFPRLSYTVQDQDGSEPARSPGMVLPHRGPVRTLAFQSHLQHPPSIHAATAQMVSTWLSKSYHS
jgi:hypothetical protein